MTHVSDEPHLRPLLDTDDCACVCVCVCVSAEALDVGEYLEISGIVRSQAGRYECKASNDVSTPDVKYVNVVVNCE